MSIHELFTGGAVRRSLAIVGLIGVLCLVLPLTVWADSGGQEVDCANCHPSDAAEWEESPHVHVATQETGTAADMECQSCHGEYVADHPASGVLAVQQVIDTEKQSVELAGMADQVRKLATQLDEAKRANDSLKATSVVSLGFGLGIGAILGVIGVFIVSRLIEERAAK
jgi:hypothetical protein